MRNVTHSLPMSGRTLAKQQQTVTQEQARPRVM
jgi:hypothetical protein